MSASWASGSGLQGLKKIHILGVGGSLMGAFAVFLKKNGIEVSGSDQGIYPPMSDVLADAGVVLKEGYRADHVPEDVDLVIIGNVIRKDNPEARAVLNGKVAYCSLPEFMEKRFLGPTKNLVVSGTHGKTTTSALLTHLLRTTGRKTSHFVGGTCPDLPGPFLHEEGNDYFVLEGDEYDTAFWDKVPKFNHYLPDYVLLTSIEFDHADIYKDLGEVIRAFEGLVDRIRKGGRLIACADYPEVVRMLSRAEVDVLTYGFSDKAQFRPVDIRIEELGTSFKVRKGDQTLADLTIPLFGDHNVLNALAAWMEADGLGIDRSEIREAFKSFQGVRRRQEIRGTVRGATIVEDFAHHPTAVKTTIDGLKKRFHGRRLVVAFEPRSATSRRKIFQKEYVDALEGADQIWIAPPFDQTRIDEDDRFSAEQLIADLQGRAREAQILLEGAESLLPTLKKGDVLAILSNGGFGGLISELLKSR